MKDGISLLLWNYPKHLTKIYKSVDFKTLNIRKWSTVSPRVRKQMKCSPQSLQSPDRMAWVAFQAMAQRGNPRGAWWLPQVGKVELRAREVQRSEVTGQSSQEDRDRQRHTEGPLEYLDKSDQCSLWGQCPRPGKAFQAGLEGTLPRAHRRPGLVLVPTGRVENLTIPGASERPGGSRPGAVPKSALDWSLVGTT